MRQIERLSNSSGFTFLEVIIVLLILAILASSTLPQYIQSKTTQKLIDRDVRNITAIQDAARWFYADHDRWPANFNELISPPADKNGNPVQPYLPSGFSTTTAFGTPIQMSSNNNFLTISFSAAPELHGYYASQLPMTTASSNIFMTSIPKPGLEAMLDGLREEFKKALKSLDIHDFQYSGIVNPGTAINKPVCKQGQMPYIYVTPVFARTGTSGYPMLGYVGYATDNGNSWTVYGAVRGQDGNTYTAPGDIKLLAYTVCL